MKRKCGSQDSTSRAAVRMPETAHVKYRVSGQKGAEPQPCPVYGLWVSAPAPVTEASRAGIWLSGRVLAQHARGAGFDPQYGC